MISKKDLKILKNNENVYNTLKCLYGNCEREPLI